MTCQLTVLELTRARPPPDFSSSSTCSLFVYPQILNPRSSKAAFPWLHIEARYALGLYSTLSPLKRQTVAVVQVFVADAWLGGNATQGDHANVLFELLDEGGMPIDDFTLEGPSSVDRDGETKLMLVTKPPFVPLRVPAAAATLQVTLTATREDGLNNDGYADSISFITGRRALHHLSLSFV